VAQILKISAAYTPPPPEGFVSPMTWGAEEEVNARFTAAGVPEHNIICERDTFTFNYRGTPQDFVGEFRNYYGPTMNAFAAAEESAAQSNFRRTSKHYSPAKTQVQTQMPPAYQRRFCA
jgi:hypothetical protein